MNHLSTLALHRLRLGELPPDEEGRLRRHLVDCLECAARLDQQLDHRQRFQQAPLPPWAQPKRLWWERWSWGLMAVPVMGIAWFSLQSPPPIAAVEAPAADGIYSKGAGTILEAWVETGKSPRPLYEGESVQTGTRVQLRFNPGTHRFVTLAGRDGKGVVEVYGTLQSKGSGLQTAPFSLTLDNTKGEQVFFAVMTDIRPDVERIKVQLSHDPVRIEGAELTSIVLQKD